MNKKTRKAPNSARFTAVSKKVEAEKLYSLSEAIGLAKETASAKFVESVDIAIRLGIDPRKSDQNVRGLTNLPHGTGKTKKVAVIASADKASEAEEAGADKVGGDELIAAILDGFKDFDVLLASDDMAQKIGRLGKVLGPKTPSPRNGCLTSNIGTAVREIKGATRVNYRADKAGVVHMPVGKVNFDDDKIAENIRVAYDAVMKAKPASAKGKYVLTVTLSSTMGPGVGIDPATIMK